MQIAVQAVAPDQDVALAAAMVPELRTFGQALDLTIFGAGFSNTVKNELAKSTFYASHTAVLGNDAITSVQTVRGMVDGPQKQALVRAIWLGTRAVWIACIPFFAVSAVASIGAKELNLDRVLSA